MRGNAAVDGLALKHDGIKNATFIQGDEPVGSWYIGEAVSKKVDTGETRIRTLDDGTTRTEKVFREEIPGIDVKSVQQRENSKFDYTKMVRSKKISLKKERAPRKKDKQQS